MLKLAIDGYKNNPKLLVNCTIMALFAILITSNTCLLKLTTSNTFQKLTPLNLYTSCKHSHCITIQTEVQECKLLPTVSFCIEAHNVNGRRAPVLGSVILTQSSTTPWLSGMVCSMNS